MQTALVVTKDTLDAQRMNKKHWSIVGKQNSAKIEAASLGEDLIAKKKELKHGEFKPWIEENCEFSYRTARVYVQVAKAKMAARCQFDACSSINEVLELGKKPKDKPKVKLEPTEDDLKTMGRLQTLAERGATEGEREAAKAKLEAYASAFGDSKEEAVERAKQAQAQEAEDEYINQRLEGVKRRLRKQGDEWLADQLLWAMAQDMKIFKTISERIVK